MLCLSWICTKLLIACSQCCIEALFAVFLLFRELASVSSLMTRMKYIGHLCVGINELPAYKNHNLNLTAPSPILVLFIYYALCRQVVNHYCFSFVGID